MKTSTQRKKSGFTIIEVLIVLAIAGLIIAIVLFAVPALQRNGRNTAIKNDANSIVGYVSDFMSNNDGAVATSITVSSGTVTVAGAAGSGTQSTTGAIQKGTTFNNTLVGAQSGVNPGIGTMTINTGAKCSDTVGASTAAARSVAIFYSIETSGSSNLVKCVSN